MRLLRCGTPRPCRASMKVPPKRKGNLEGEVIIDEAQDRLNESPSEKEGK